MGTHLWEATVKGEMLGQEWMNVFFYTSVESDPETTDALDVCAALATALSTTWAALVTNETKFHTITVRDLYELANVASMVWPIAQGGSVSESLMSFLTLSFQFPSTNSLVKSGGKRLAGANELVYADGVLSPSGGFLTAITNFMLAMVATPTVLDSSSFANELVPVVVKRIREGVAGAYTYRLPENLGETTGFQIETIEFNGVSTQNTRKPPVLTTPYGI